MFGALKELVKRGESIDENKLIQDALATDSIDRQIIDLNQKQLYDKGIQADGTPTGSYSPTTMRYKEVYGDSWNTPGETGHITGNDTGVTYRSMKVVAEDNAVVVEADDRNNFFQREPKGLGLTSDSIGEIIPEIREAIIEKIKETLFA